MIGLSNTEIADPEEKTPVYGYVRVSTSLQDPQMQINSIKKHCENYNLNLVRIFKDIKSGSDDTRKGYQEMLKLINDEHRDIKAIIVWKIDRLSRSQKELMCAIDHFRDNNIRFISVQEGIDTSIKGSRLMMSMLAILSDFEKTLIQERVQAGVDNFLANGGRLGRPVKELNMTRIRSDIKRGVPKTLIAKNNGVSKSTLYKALNNPDNYVKLDEEFVRQMYDDGESIRNIANELGVTDRKIYECLLPKQTKEVI